MKRIRINYATPVPRCWTLRFVIALPTSARPINHRKSTGTPRETGEFVNRKSPRGRGMQKEKDSADPFRTNIPRCNWKADYPGITAIAGEHPALLYFQGHWYSTRSTPRQFPVVWEYHSLRWRCLDGPGPFFNAPRVRRQTYDSAADYFRAIALPSRFPPRVVVESIGEVANAREIFAGNWRGLKEVYRDDEIWTLAEPPVPLDFWL